MQGAQGVQGPSGGGGGGSALTLATLKSYSETIIANEVSANNATPTVIESYSIPVGAQNKVAFVQAYFYLKNQNFWPNGSTIQYGFSVDGTLVTSQGDLLPKYSQTTATSNYMVGAYNGIVSGTNGIGLPFVFPVSLGPSAASLQAVVQNSSLPLVTVQTGAVTTTTFTYTGNLQTFTVPANITAITVHLWGAGGLCQNNNPPAGTVPGGSGAAACAGYTTGNLAVTPGQVIFVVCGGCGQTTTVRGRGSSGNTGAGGGGFSALFSSNPTTLTTVQLQAALISLAGGGGGAGLNGGGFGGGGGGLSGDGGKNAGGTTLIAGATQTTGGGAGALQGSLMTAANSSGGGGGGGGYFGGGGGGNAQPGSGGSGFVGLLTSGSTTMGTSPTSTAVWAAPPQFALMQSLFGANSFFGGSYQHGAVAIITQGTYPTYIGSTVTCTY